MMIIHPIQYIYVSTQKDEDDSIKIQFFSEGFELEVSDKLVSM